MLKALAKTTKRAVKPGTKSKADEHNSEPAIAATIPRSVATTPPCPGAPAVTVPKSILKTKSATTNDDLEIVKYSAPFRILEANAQSETGGSGLNVQVVFASASCVNIVNKSFVDMTGMGKHIQKREEVVDIIKAGMGYENLVYGYIYLTLEFLGDSPTEHFDTSNRQEPVRHRVPFLVLKHTMFPVIWGRDGNSVMSALDPKRRTLDGVSFKQQEQRVDVPAVKLLQNVPTASVYKLVRSEPAWVSLLPWTVEDVVVHRPLPERIIHTKGFEHKIELINGDNSVEKPNGTGVSTTGSTPAILTPAHTPYSSNRSSPGPELHLDEETLEELNRKTLNEMVANKQIRASQSKNLSPIVWDYDSASFRVDYTDLNAKIIPDSSYQLPKHKHLINQIGRGQMFSRLKLLDAYRQIPLREKDRHLTAFSTPYGSFEYNVLPHGLLNSDISLQRTVDSITTNKLASSYAAGYQDTIVIYSQTKAAHSEHTMRILEALAANGLYADSTEYDVFQNEIEFLDHTIRHNEISPASSHVYRIEQEFADKELTQQQARTLLRRMGYFRRFIRNYAHLTGPIHDYVHTIDGEWSKDCTQSVRNVIEQLKGPITLAVPDLSEGNAGFIIETIIPKECHKIISAQLLQVTGINELQTIEFFSKRLTSNDSVALSQLEKQVFSIVQAVDHWRSFAKKGPITVRANQQVLSALTNSQDDESACLRRIRNWRQVLGKCRISYALAPETGTQHENDSADLL